MVCCVLLVPFCHDADPSHLDTGTVTPDGGQQQEGGSGATPSTPPGQDAATAGAVTDGGSGAAAASGNGSNNGGGGVLAGLLGLSRAAAAKAGSLLTESLPPIKFELEIIITRFEAELMLWTAPPPSDRWVPARLTPRDPPLLTYGLEDPGCGVPSVCSSPQWVYAWAPCPT